MNKRMLITLLAASAAVVRADFTYQETTQMTGGMMMNTMRALGPLAGGAREPIVSTHLLKGNRMATITKDRTSVMDLDKETITTIDNARKTYSVMTFAEMKQAMEDAARRMQGRQKGDVQAQFKISAKATGQTKSVQGLSAKEMVINLAMEGKSAGGDSGAMEMTTDAWYAPVPGYEEVKAFHLRMAEKMGSVFGSGMQQMAQMMSAQGQGNAKEGMEQVARELAKIDGVPVESVVKMGMSGMSAGGDSGGASSAPPPRAEAQERPSVGGALAGAALGRFGGFGRKKKEEPRQEAPPASASAPAPQATSGTLMEMTMTLTSFSSGPVDGSKFDVPAGFKQVEPEMRRPGRGN